MIDGAKRWIGNGSVADVVVVWARDTEDGRVKGFLVELPTKGYEATVIEGKVPVRAIWNAHIVLDGVRVPAATCSRGAKPTRAASSRATRTTCAYAALGHAVAAYDAALTYTRSRRQFGKPLASFQIVQEKLVRCSPRSPRCGSTAWRIWTAHRGGTPLGHDRRLGGGFNNTVKARECDRGGANLLGGNGILLENHVSYMADIEAIYTFEGPRRSRRWS